MLSGTKLNIGGSCAVRCQRGLVLVMVLIVLTAMMLAGIALMRSVNTSTLVAGNMAFRQAATHQGDVGTETAIAWLQANSGATLQVQGSNAALGYFDKIQGPSSSQTWDQYWQTVLDITPVARPVAVAVNSGSVWTLATVNGYTVSYVIHRMCGADGDPAVATTLCVQSPTSGTSTGDSNSSGSFGFTFNSQVYYRITSRIQGPRNTVSYTQAVIAM